MPRWTIAHSRWLALAGVAAVSIAVLSIAVPVSARAPSDAQATAARQSATVGSSAQHDHAVHQAATGGATGVDAEIARLLTRMDETTGDERMAVMTELITLLVQDRAARTGTAPAATTAAPMCAMCAEHQAGGGHACAMCAEHQTGGGQTCAMCAEPQSAGNGQMCAACAGQHSGTSDRTAGAATNASCCAGHK